MKYSTIIGLVLVVVGLLLFILQEPVYVTEKEFYIAGFLGLGIGLTLGGFMGYAQKKRKKVVNNTFTPTSPDTPTIETKIKEDNSGLKF